MDVGIVVGSVWALVLLLGVYCIVGLIIRHHTDWRVGSISVNKHLIYKEDEFLYFPFVFALVQSRWIIQNN